MSSLNLSQGLFSVPSDLLGSRAHTVLFYNVHSRDVIFGKYLCVLSSLNSTRVCLVEKLIQRC